MNNTEMGNQTDLDWLARNVHEWPEDGVKPIFSKNQWLTRRAELQNKPSWEDAPEWANWLGQTSRGAWEWFQGIQAPDDRDDGCWSYNQLGESSGKYGEVLGDWRDTLERRPETKALAQAEVELVNAMAEVFQPFTSIEDNQGQDMKQDNGWFERGELPPVGTECEFCWEDDEWTDWHKSVFVGFDSMGDGVVSVFGDHKGLLYFSNKPTDFRPLRTEREKAIEDMFLIIEASSKWGVIDYLGALYDAGYRKESK